jgi:hypothetical protein
VYSSHPAGTTGSVVGTSVEIAVGTSGSIVGTSVGTSVEGGMKAVGGTVGVVGPQPKTAAPMANAIPRMIHLFFNFLLSV